MAGRDDEPSRVAPSARPGPPLSSSPSSHLDGDRQRSLPSWAWLAAPALAAGGLVVLAALGLLFGGPARRYRAAMELVLVFGLLGAGLAIVLAGLAAQRAHLGPAAFVRTLWMFWARPRRDWIMFVFGALLSLPVASLMTTVLIGDSDSARLVASIQYVRHLDWRYLIHTQENYLPHLVMGPLLSIGGISALKLFSLLTLQALAGVVSLITWKLSRDALAVLLSVAALLAFQGIVKSVALLPMYPAMLALGYAGTYLAYRAVVPGRRRMAFAVGAGACLALSPEAQPVGQVFLLLPLALVVLIGVRRALGGLVRVYLALAAFIVPRAVINLSEGGLAHVLSYRVDYWVTKGYLVEIQKRFFRYPSRFGYAGYFSQLAGHATRITGRLGLVIAVLAVLGVLFGPSKIRRFGIVACAVVVGPFLVARAPFFPRYFSAAMVGAALVVGLAFAGMSRGRRYARGVGVALVVVMGMLAVVTIVGTLRDVRGREASVASGPYRALAARIRDGKGVIGSRSMYLLFVDPDIRTYGTQFLSEKEFVTYLTWPSDATVLEILRRHDIGWVLLTGDRWELRYNNTWLVPAYGKGARQVWAVAETSRFCLAMKAPPFRLYKVGC